MKTIKAVLYVFIVLFVGMSLFLPAIAGAQPSITSPPPGPLVFGDVTFQWNAGGTIVTEYWLWVGPCTVPTFNGCGDDYLNSGSLGLNTTQFVSGSVFPTDGSTVYVRLWYKTGGVWQTVLAQYTAVALLQPKITEVHLDPSGTSIHIEGDNITEDLTVMLGDYIDPLDCLSNLSIDCQLPEGIKIPGDYLLRVETIDGKYDEYDLTIAADLTDALCALYSATGEPFPAVCTKLVFVTSEKGTGVMDAWNSSGNASGLQGADNVCNALASNAGLLGTYKAWLSTSTVDAKDRITDARYVNTIGQVVADDLADLTDGGIDKPVGYDENGDPVSGNVWTGTKADGTKKLEDPSAHCDDWIADDETGETGDPQLNNAEWTDRNTGVGGPWNCPEQKALYCFQL